MVYKLKLQNVTSFGDDANPGSIGYKYYGVTAQGQGPGATTQLTLNNAELYT